VVIAGRQRRLSIRADGNAIHRLGIPQRSFYDGDRKWLERFVREAKSNVQHPNICTVYDSGIHDGQPFISMAYIKGQALTALITPENPLPEAESAGLVRIVARAMHAAHQAGIVHRDIKPHNIMIDELGQPIVTDFGLARKLSEDTASLTSEGKFVGTVAYMSPEQFDENSDHVTHSTDIYSLGVTFYEMLTGRRPFQGTAAQILRQIQVQAPEPPTRLRPQLDQALEATCLRMMAKGSVWKPTPHADLSLRFRHDLEAARASWIADARGDTAERKRREESNFLKYVYHDGIRNVFADFHGLRHTGITFVARIAGLRVAQAWADHSMPVLTARYAHVDLADATKAISALPHLSKPVDPQANKRKAAG
jgi:serine/threonine protein kinase